MPSIIKRCAAFFALAIIALSSSISLACEEPPLPLRGMFLESDLIVVGKIGKPGKWIAGPKEGESDYQIFNRSFPIHVEKVIKGDAGSKLAIYEDTYHYFGDNSENNGGLKPARVPAADLETELSKDTTRRLFFMKKDENGHYTEIYSNRYEFAPKGKDMETYIARLGELTEMYHSGEPSKETIVEWLVSMAENPATRMEGAYELRESFYDLKWRTQQEADEAEAAKAQEHSEGEETVKSEVVVDMPAVAENPETPDENRPEHPEGEEEYAQYGEADFARILTAAQKERLVKAFFSVKWDYTPKKYEGSENEDTYVQVLNEGDRHLVDAVLLMGDRRAINRVIAELPVISKHETYIVADLLSILADGAKNEKLRTLADRYSEVAYGNSDDVIEQKSSAYDMDDFEGTDEQKAALLAAQPNKTYGQRRAELLDRIYASLNQPVAKK